MTDRPLSAAAGEPSTGKRQKSGLLRAFVALVAILALLGGFIFYRTAGLIGNAGHSADRLVRDAFLAVAHLQPKVTINERVIYEQTTPVLEVAVVERDISVERETTDTWLGSTKRVRVRAVYHVKAGFDLREPFDVRLESPAGRQISARLPPARLLSAEQIKLETLDVQNGMWNHVAPDELKTELNTLNTEARLKALDAGMPREAQASLAQQLRERLGADYPIEVSFSNAPAVQTSPLR